MEPFSRGIYISRSKIVPLSSYHLLQYSHLLHHVEAFRDEHRDMLSKAEEWSLIDLLSSVGTSTFYQCGHPQARGYIGYHRCRPCGRDLVCQSAPMQVHMPYESACRRGASWWPLLPCI